eukprot:986295-Pleurochrysis_carterae.AAC.1
MFTHDVRAVSRSHVNPRFVDRPSRPLALTMVRFRLSMKCARSYDTLKAAEAFFTEDIARWSCLVVDEARGRVRVRLR